MTVDHDESDTATSPDPPPPSSGRRRRLGPWSKRLLWAAFTVAAAVGCIALSLWLTPMQKVDAAGQTVEVGVTAPSWSVSGPGELDLFGQSIPTVTQFDGPVRPRLALSRITLSEQLAQLTNSSPDTAAHDLQHALVSGFKRFFAWQILVVAVTAVVVFGAVAGWLRRGARQSVVLIASGVVVALGLDLGAIMVTAYSAPSKLSHVRSLQDLVGNSTPTDVTRHRESRTSPVSNVVVIGDSTAAGLGNPPLVGGNADDKACGRSQDAFAVALAQASRWHVTNLACSGATIRAGLLGPQTADGRTQPAQLSSSAITKADAIVVSIGANDLHWVDLLRLCAISSSCSNNAEQAYLQQQLAGFSADLLELLSELQLLPNHPLVVVNQYYDPFSGSIDCLKDKGLTQAKKSVLERDLNAMNAILASGAKAAGFITALPDYSDHGVCSDAPYVQGLDDSAPFHPTASGELAIALAVEHVLHPSEDSGGN